MSHTIATPNGMGEETVRDHVEMQHIYAVMLMASTCPGIVENNLDGVQNKWCSHNDVYSLRLY